MKTKAIAGGWDGDSSRRVEGGGDMMMGVTVKNEDSQDAIFYKGVVTNRKPRLFGFAWCPIPHNLFGEVFYGLERTQG